jgi:hypothetical protein
MLSPKDSSALEAPAKRIAGVLGVERRRSSRFDVRLRLVFPLGGRMVQAHSLDLSESGMRFECPAPIDKGTQLVIHFARHGDNTMHRIAGEVVWARPPSGGSVLFVCGFRFGIMDPVARQVLLSLLPAEAAGLDGLPEVSADEVVEIEADGPGESGALSAAVQADEHRQAERRGEAEALRQEARTASAAGDVDKAIQLLEQAMALAPESTEVIEELARELYLKGDVARAAALFDRALRVSQGG